MGEYTFAPWKVAIAGLYKKLEFHVLGQVKRAPVVFDDTVYFLGCASRAEAELLPEILHSKAAQDFLSSFVFWDAKRPITADILSKLDLLRLAQQAGRGEEFLRLRPDVGGWVENRTEGLLFY